MAEATLTICRPIGGPTLHADAPSDQTACLVRIYPAEGPCGLWNLHTDEVFLGRGIDADIQLEDEAASRKHAAIQRDEGGFLLVDLGSTNGTFVNDERVQQHRLAAGDRIRIGSHVLKYLSSDHIEVQYHETVFRMTTRDGLTQAYNREYLTEFAERELSRSKDRGRPVSVAMLDVDYFKVINDRYGHLAGDEVLRGICERTSNALNAGDILARYGGEEFCAVFCESGEDEAKKLAEAIRSAIASAPFITTSNEVAVTASIGIVTWDGMGGDLSVQEFIASADERLYKAKKAGRDQISWAKITPRRYRPASD